MRDILDPADMSVGTPVAAPLFAPIPRPVAVDDALTVLRDSGPVSIAVLANDFDPIDGVPTLASAFAALGTAVAEADGTVTYTPPPGLTGFDTVVYEVSNSAGRTDTAQINIAIEAPSQTLSVDVTAEQTLVVTADPGLIEINVIDPPEFRNSYTFDTADLAAGPVNLAAPGVTGPFAVGQTVTAVPGLWAIDSGGGTLSRAYQWFRGTTAISGATAGSYTVQSADLGPGVAVRESLTDAFGTRSADSAIHTGTPTFSPAADAQLIGWFDAADESTISAISGAVFEWADKAGGDPLVQTSSLFRPLTGSRTQNGLNLVNFQGNAFMRRAQALPADGDVSFHGVFLVDAVDNAFEAVLAVDATVDFQIDANSPTQFSGRLNLAGAGTSVNLGGGPFSGAFVLSVIFDRTGAGAADVYVSDVLRGQTAYTTSLDVATQLYVMTNRSQNAFADGAVCELAITRSTDNRSEYHAYLAAKWGVA